MLHQDGKESDSMLSPESSLTSASSSGIIQLQNLAKNLHQVKYTMPRKKELPGFTIYIYKSRQFILFGTVIF